MKWLTNRRTRAYLGLAACALFCAAAAPILAHDFMIPNYRGDELTVYSEWDFNLDFDYNGDPNNIPPDNLDWVGKPGYELYDTVTHCHVQYMTWVDGIWHVDPVYEFGEVYIWLVNWVDDMPVKHLWIQITYGGQGAPPVVVSIVGRKIVIYPDETFEYFYYDGVSKNFIEHSHTQRVEDWMIEPNPDSEAILIHVPAGTWLDQIVIDTISTWDYTSTENKTLSGVKSLFR